MIGNHSPEKLRLMKSIIIARSFTLYILLVLTVFSLNAQDCQLATMDVVIPEGVAKHHFPVQEMPSSFSADHFTYAAAWDQGDLTIRIRFSEDGDTWTNWQVLKRNFCDPKGKSSPLNITEQQYQYFEWAVYNKSGMASELTFNFYHPTEDMLYSDVAGDYAFETSAVGCPQLDLAPVVQGTPVVTTNEDE